MVSDTEIQEHVGTGQRPESEGQVMTSFRFRQSLDRLGYNISTANQLLGIGRTTIYRISKNQAKVPGVVARLLDMYERFGVPEEHK